jgi:ribulose kinase
VPHPAGVLGDPDHLEAVVADPQLADVVGLSAAARVEDGAVEQHAAVVGIGVHDGRARLALVLVGGVDALGHVVSLARTP